MIANERLATYIDSLDAGNTPFLDRVEQKALDGLVPVIRKGTQQFLKWILSVKRPERILEIGTAVGFSALLMAEYDPVFARIVTIENDAGRILSARENFKEAGRQEQIELLEGDAKDILPSLDGLFDFVFLDAAKGQYARFLPEIACLLRIGGILVTDNVLQDGDIIESRFAVTRRNRTIHKRMREYLYEVTHSPLFVSTVLPVGDGLAVSTRK